MTTRTHTKGIATNGARIKALRKKAGHTQKGLIRGTGIELRTYQRAEQGLSILPEILQQIAVRLGVEANSLRASAGDHSEPTNTYRLLCAAQVGARKLLEELQWGNDRVNYRIEIDPNSEVAEKVASLIETCEDIEKKLGNSYGRTDPAQKVRIIGSLNDMIKDVATCGVNLYFGNYLEYEERKDKKRLFGPELTGGDNLVPYTVSLSRRLVIVLSHETVPLITKPLSKWSTLEAAINRAVKYNLEMDILPEWLGEPCPFGVEEELFAAYRSAFLEKGPKLLLSRMDADLTPGRHGLIAN